MSKQHRPDREVPPDYKNLIELEHWFQPSWKERFKVMLGFNLVVRAAIFTVNKPGRFHYVMRCSTSDKPMPKQDLGHQGPPPRQLSNAKS